MPAKETPAPVETPIEFTSVALASLPKPKSVGRTFDRERAEKLYAILTAKPGEDGATLPTTYPTLAEARNVANKYRRLVMSLIERDKLEPDTTIIRATVAGSDETGKLAPFRFALGLYRDQEPPKPRQRKAKDDAATESVEAPSEPETLPTS